jgi:hypothetical protein
MYRPVEPNDTGNFHDFDPTTVMGPRGHSRSPFSAVQSAHITDSSDHEHGKSTDSL